MKYFLITIFAFFSITAFARAATMTLDAPASAALGEQFAVDVVVDTGGASINSVEASVSYPGDVLEFSGYQENAGVVRFWISPPKAANGEVSFAGGIPGGADHVVGGTTLTVVRLLFNSKAAGTALLAINHSTMLKNDGKGTALPHTTAGAAVLVSPGAATQPTSDTLPPQPFSVEYIPKERTAGTPALITFNAVDRESGIAKYQVKLGWGAWRDASSPYPVPYRFFSYSASVRAVDSSGNAHIERTTVPGTMPWWVGIIVAGALATGFWLYFMVQRKV